MKKSTVFLIVGAAFLASGAIGLVQGQFGTRHEGGRVITRTGDPERYWRTEVETVLVGGACLFLSRRQKQ